MNHLTDRAHPTRRRITAAFVAGLAVATILCAATSPDQARAQQLRTAGSTAALPTAEPAPTVSVAEPVVAVDESTTTTTAVQAPAAMVPEVVATTATTTTVQPATARPGRYDCNGVAQAAQYDMPCVPVPSAPVEVPSLEAPIDPELLLPPIYGHYDCAGVDQAGQFAHPCVLDDPGE